MTGDKTTGSGRRPARRRGGRRGGGLKGRGDPPPPVSEEARGRLIDTLENGHFIVFDIETTGGNPDKNGITEIFALKYHKGQVGETFYSLVNPGIPIPPIVRRMTGINNKMLKGEPRIRDVMPGFVEFVGSDVLVSHNTIGDMKFLRHFAKQVCKKTLDNFYLCTHLLVEKLAHEAPDKSLKGLAEHFHLPTDGDLHRATADAYVTLELFKVLLGRLGERSVKQVIEAVRLQGDMESAVRLGWGVDESKLDLPRSPGLFSLHDHEGKLTFLSSAFDLSREVAKLHAYDQLPRQMLRLVLRSSELRHEPTPNGLSALLLECKAVTRQKPPFDPTGWHQRSVQALTLTEDEGKVRVAVGNLEKGTYAAYGPIRDRKAAQAVIDLMGDVLGVKVSRKGVLIPKDTAEVLAAHLATLWDGRKGSRKVRKKRFSLRLLFKPQERRHAAERARLEKSLESIQLKPALGPLLEINGAAVLPSGRPGEWQVLMIVRGLSAGETVLKTGKGTEIAAGLVAPVARESIKRAYESSGPKALSAAEARETGAILWWIHGRKGAGHWFSLEELEGTP